ncbi:putative reverse transcriptase domain-containing protein [Tanacetum coccineum]
MRQRRWIELFSDYDCEIRYHPGKANAQNEASETVNAPAEMLRGLDDQIKRRSDGALYYLDRIWVPLMGNVRTLIMDEAYKSRYSVHPGVDKMYYDLRDMYWWLGIKKDIALYVSKCLTCSKIKAEHQRPSSLLQQPEILEWKWERITMDFITKLPRTENGHDAIWVIVDRLTKSAHFLPIREDFKMDRLTRLYLNEIIERHGVPISIISDRDKSLYIKVLAVNARNTRNPTRHESALRDVFVPLSEPLSITTLTGTEGTSEVMPVTTSITTALSVTSASASLIYPISTDDYEVAPATSQEGVGADANPFPDDADLNIQMFPEEVDKIEKYIGGLPDMILGSVKASKPKTMQEAIEFTTELMDEKTHAYAERQAEKKRNDRKPYAEPKPLCSKCNYNHEGPCPPRCNNCKKVGHLAKDCRSRPANANNNNHNNNNNNQKGNGCYKCGAQRHFRINSPKLKNNDRGNQAGNDKAPAKVYVVGNAGANPDNVVAGTFLLNNRYAYILFDTGADRSFVSTAFSSQIDITPSTLDHYYDVELADGRIIGLNTILSGCTLNFLNHPFNINLMPVELGSFDAIIGMDWLAKYQAVIVCAEKIVRIPWRNKTLIIHGDGSNQGNVTRLNIISCTKTQKYMQKGFPIFLAHVTAKEVEDKSEKKRLEDVPIVRDFPELGHLTIGASRECKRIIRALKEDVRQRLYKTLFLTWGAPVLFVPKAMMDIFGLSNSKGHLKVRLSPTEVSRRRHSKDSLSELYPPFANFKFVPFGLTKQPAIIMDIMNSGGKSQTWNTCAQSYCDRDPSSPQISEVTANREGTNLDMSTPAYHPQTERQARDHSKTHKDMLRACAIPVLEEGVGSTFAISRVFIQQYYHTSIKASTIRSTYG